MESYTDFAYIYDKLIDQDYEKWADYIEEIFKKHNVNPKLVLDLGCGTGSITNILAKRGYDMIGVDLSPDMLNVARDKAMEEGLDVLYLCQDIREFELYGTVDAIICTLDVLNYITEPKDLQQVFALVKNYLNPDGIFVFDINTEHKLKNVLGNNTFINDENGIFYTWENEYNNNISNQFLTFFAETEDGLYERFDEQHIQRAYTIDEIKEKLAVNKLSFEGEYKLFSFDTPGSDCEKSVIVSKCFG
ncbi:MAG: class I SAM-dependent methyltransferase [Clostridia bacterium]|nr:class I SAM-dependent methyltransferase [Clostridia bacterium]